jgi:2-(1,2-epoxy-1,2-dihydrophenyl)acetyl-CoA isomerase
MSTEAGGITADEHLHVDRVGTRLNLTLDHAERKNALTVEMIATITHHVDAAVLDDVTRVIVLRSRGADFCTGIDLAQSNQAQSNQAEERPRVGHLQRRMMQGSHRMIRTLHEAQLPIVAGVTGWAAGVGNALALSADVVIADETAKFWVPFVGKGFTPDSANTYILPRLVGLARAKEMIMRAKPIDAVTALSWGMISEVVPAGDLDRAVDAAAGELEAAATVSVGLAKTLIHRNIDADLTSALQNEAIYEEVAVRSDDFKEGMRSFVQKRRPDYTGR